MRIAVGCKGYLLQIAHSTHPLSFLSRESSPHSPGLPNRRRLTDDSLLARPSLGDALGDPESDEADRNDEDDTEHDDL